jgi:hypothetical protein
MNRNRETYGVEEEPMLALALILGVSLLSPMLSKRLLILGKKFLSEKISSASVMRMKPVVAQSAPQKPYALSPVQDHKRRGFGQWPTAPARGARHKTGCGRR